MPEEKLILSNEMGYRLGASGPPELIFTCNGSQSIEDSWALARRLVACWNALVNFNIDDIETGTFTLTKAP